jgi:hypothetical protein
MITYFLPFFGWSSSTDAFFAFAAFGSLVTSVETLVFAPVVVGSAAFPITPPRTKVPQVQLFFPVCAFLARSIAIVAAASTTQSKLACPTE